MKTVNVGEIVEQNLSTIDDAIHAKHQWEEGHARAIQTMKVSGHSTGLKHYTYEITGVAGDYRIIRRDSDATESRYVN